MQTQRRSLFLSLALIAAGVCGFFLFLFLTGHDPDETPLTLIEWVVGGVLIAPGFCYLLRWRALKGR